MPDKDHADIKPSLSGWMMILAGIPLFLGLEVPKFSVPKASWIDDAVQAGFIATSATMFLIGAILWLYQSRIQKAQESTQESTDGPVVS